MEVGGSRDMHEKEEKGEAGWGGLRAGQRSRRIESEPVCKQRTSCFTGPTADADVGVRPRVLRLHEPLPGILNMASAQNLFGSGTRVEEPQRRGQESFAPVF